MNHVMRPPLLGHLLLRAGLASGIAAAVFSAGASLGAAAITTASMIDEMTDLAGLALFPSPAYTCRQFSSYDPKSKSPSNPTTEDWFANADAGHYLRVEDHAGRKEHVMMDAAGPGAIVRIWSANPAGTIRIYLDEAEQPILKAPMTDLLGGKVPGLPRPIAGEYSRGWNLYFPIPYAKHCKVTSDQGGFYYHVNYRTYTAGTAVQSFTPDQFQTLAPRIERLVKRLADPRGDASDLGGDSQGFDLEVPAGDTLTREFTGPMAFTWVALRVKAANPETALRGLVVKWRFDGEHCVEGPLGDLLGSGPGLNAFSTLPLGVGKDGMMYSHWFMPFKETAVVELVNHTKDSVFLTGEVGFKDYEWTDRSMHLHAKWRAQFDVPTRPMIDWNYLTARGQGVFAGVSFTIDNPVKDWWGEGDEKIYVDGEKFPSHFGTGTEDYYGYAWGWPGLFTHAYHAQPRCDGPGSYGRTSVNRFHILDRIPFTRDFKFDMELWHWHATSRVNMGVVAYWYARPGARDTFQPIAAADTVVRPMPAYVAPRVAGAIEGETMKIAKVTGKAEPQEWGDISAGKQLWWHEGMKPGDTLTVLFPAPKAGKYRVFGRFLKAPDYGVHQLSINGQKTGPPVDFYEAQARATSQRDLGLFDLKQGDNEFSVTVTGANEKAVKSYMFGLDYLLLKPAE